MKYRAEIDGLRALAVVPVILFHAGFELFSGGFVGVDAFFVISGYLITTILIEDIENKRFIIVNFYERRIRRILPALFFVVLVCIPFAWIWMLPSEMKEFSQSLVAVSLFASNILFWQESGYFETAAEEKPLLHTWSLAVEEQYYLFFPLFLILFWRFGKKRVFWTIVIIATVSLILSEWGWRYRAAANFYLAPTRAWELLAGSLVAFVVQKNGVVKNDLLALIGLIAIVFSIFVYDNSTPFPSVYTLVPVLGVVLVVLYAHKDTLAARILSAKVFVGLGLISFSAYLWHQPLLAFARIKSGNEPSDLLMGLLALSSLPLAYLSWNFIEIPFRNKAKIRRRNIFFLTFVGFFILSVFGFIGHVTDGFKDRFVMFFEGDIGAREYISYVDKQYLDCEPTAIASAAPIFEGYLQCKQSKQGEFDWLLLGDSHAEHLFLGLAEANPSVNIAFYILDEKPYYGNEAFEDIFDEIATLGSPKTILLTMHYISRENNSEELVDGFSRTIEFLQNLGHRVILIGDIPAYNASPERCKYGDTIGQATLHCSMPNNQFLLQLNYFEPLLLKLANKYNSPYIRIHEALCLSSTCSMKSDGVIFYRDNNHLNIPGSRLIGKYLSSKLDEFR